MICLQSSDPRYYNFRDSANKAMEALVGQEFYFYGSASDAFKIDNMVLEVLGDPQDGYRSSMGAVVINDELSDGKIFSKRPLAKVKLEVAPSEFIYGVEKTYDGADYNLSEYDFDGYRLVDVETGHSWLHFGTGNTSDYYPYFVFRYYPDKNAKTYPKIPAGYKTFEERFPEIVLKAPDWFCGGVTLDFGY